MPTSTRFDPDRIARYEVAGWRAYYDRRWPALLQLTVAICQEQFRIPFPLSLAAAYQIVRASVAWVPIDHDLDRVRAALVRFYTLAARYAPLDFAPERVAAAEMRYWTINRELAGGRDEPRLHDALARLHDALFDLGDAAARESATWRVRALVALDRITGGTTRDAEADWREAEAALRRCYQIIGQESSARPQVDADERRRANDYRLVTHWRVRATPEEVVDIIADASDLPRWWPAVYLAAREIAPGDERGIGQVVELHAKGWLPYTIRWQSRVVASDFPRRITIAAEGDLTGSGVWTLTPDGEWTDVRYDWQVRGDKPLFRALSFLLKPAFAANHRWAMARGATSLALELRHRRATTADERAALPAPPGPTAAAPFQIAALVGGVLALGLLLARRGAKQFA